MNIRITVILYIGYTLTSVAGLVFIKSAFPAFLAARTAGNFPWLEAMQLSIGAALYIGSFGLWMVILSQNPLSTAYPIAIGLTLCFSTIVAVFFLKETVGIAKLAGILFVFLGIYLISRESA